MPAIQTLVPFVIACFVVCAVPGISVSAMVSTTLARGLAGGFAQELGAQIGRFTVVLLVAVALTAVTAVISAAFDIVKYAGAAYLIWIGWRYLTQRHTLAIAPGVSAPSRGRQVLQGFIVVWTNPKALIFLGAFLPQFVDRHQTAWPQVLVLGLAYMVAAAVTDGIYIAIVAFARGAITGRRIEIVNRIAGVVLLGAAVWLATLHQS